MTITYLSFAQGDTQVTVQPGKNQRRKKPPTFLVSHRACIKKLGSNFFDEFLTQVSPTSKIRQLSAADGFQVLLHRRAHALIGMVDTPIVVIAIDGHVEQIDFLQLGRTTKLRVVVDQYGLRVDRLLHALVTQVGLDCLSYCALGKYRKGFVRSQLRFECSLQPSHTLVEVSDHASFFYGLRGIPVRRVITLDLRLMIGLNHRDAIFETTFVASDQSPWVRFQIPRSGFGLHLREECLGLFAGGWRQLPQKVLAPLF
ncbi:hypothetical protein D9M71_309140 [compost metagenome]